MNSDQNKTSFCIYLLENNINHKKYVGQTIQKPQSRWRNGKGYVCQPAIGKAIKKYGWNNFTHIILEDNILTQEEANEKERYYIAFCKHLNHPEIYKSCGKHLETKVKLHWIKEDEK